LPRERCGFENHVGTEKLQKQYLFFGLGSKSKTALTAENALLCASATGVPMLQSEMFNFDTPSASQAGKRNGTEIAYSPVTARSWGVKPHARQSERLTKSYS
jgi:hypothetical protein